MAAGMHKTPPHQGYMRTIASSMVLYSRTRGPSGAMSTGARARQCCRGGTVRKFHRWRSIPVIFNMMIPVFAGTMCGQVFSNASLSSKYFVRHVQFTVDSNNHVTDSRSISGTITFDGGGNYAFSGTQVVG